VPDRVLSSQPKPTKQLAETTIQRKQAAVEKKELAAKLLISFNTQLTKNKGRLSKSAENANGKRSAVERKQQSTSAASKKRNTGKISGQKLSSSDQKELNEQSDQGQHQQQRQAGKSNAPPEEVRAPLSVIY
jgi:hypothetical protein